MTDGMSEGTVEKIVRLRFENDRMRSVMRLVSKRLYGLSTVLHSREAVKECAEYLDRNLGEDNSAAMKTFGEADWRGGRTVSGDMM